MRRAPTVVPPTTSSSFEPSALRFSRRVADLTQTEVAQQLGVSATQISLIERGLARPTTEQIKKLETLLHAPLTGGRP